MLLLGSGVVAPALDGEFSRGPALETAHHPSACVRGHDHTICTQLVANRLAPAEGAEVPAPTSVVALTPPLAVAPGAVRFLLAHHPARAPPAA